MSIRPSVPADQQEWNRSGLLFHLLGFLELVFLITARFTYLCLRVQKKSWGRKKQLKHVHVDTLAYSGFSHKRQTDQITVGFFCPFHVTALLSKLLPSTSDLSCLSLSWSLVQYRPPDAQLFVDDEECKD